MTDLEIIHGSALDYGPEAFASCDVMICDAPYSAHVHDSAMTSATVATGGPRGRDLGFEPLSPELRAKIAEAAAHVRGYSAIFADLEGLHGWREALAEAQAEYIRAVPWIRWSQPQITGDRPPSGCELIILAHSQTLGPRGGARPRAKRWQGPGSLTHFERRAMRGQHKHPTEKPLDLLLDLVCYLSAPGQTVLDLTAGAGTTLQACRLLGRDGIGVELDEEWAQSAGARLTLPLSGRDETRAADWAVEQHEAASAALRAPRTGHDDGTRRRAQARLEDAERVVAALS